MLAEDKTLRSETKDFVTAIAIARVSAFSCAGSSLSSSYKTVQRLGDAYTCRDLVLKKRGPKIKEPESFTINSNRNHIFYYIRQ